MSNVKRVTTPYSYSSAVLAGDYVFVGLHRGFGDTFGQQLDGVFAGLKTTLGELGLTLDNLVKVNVWLKDINDLSEMEKRFCDHFAEGHFPARMTATTEFADADCLLMIDGMAYTKA
jgi:2-iminobutanoate/2-iminopropanoate deaminase